MEIKLNKYEGEEEAQDSDVPFLNFERLKFVSCLKRHVTH